MTHWRPTKASRPQARPGSLLLDRPEVICAAVGGGSDGSGVVEDDDGDEDDGDEEDEEREAGMRRAAWRFLIFIF